MFLSQTFPESRPTKGISRAVKKKKKPKKKGDFLEKGMETHCIYHTNCIQSSEKN